MRRLSTLLALALGFTLGACLDDELTLNSECLEDADCVNDQRCVKTPELITYQEGVGWCRDDGKCAKGLQPGCGCDGVMCSGTSSVPLEAVSDVCSSEMGTARDTCLATEGNEPTFDDCTCLIDQ